MKTKTTLLLLALAGGFFGFTQLYEMKHPPTREAALRATFLLPFEPKNIDGIVLTRFGDRIELHKNGNRWDLDAPVKDRADRRAVDEILTRSEMLSQVAVLGTKKGDTKSFTDFGLGPDANVRLKLLGHNAPPELLFSTKETAVTGKCYVRLDGKENVYVVGNELRDLIVRKPEALRDHQLTELDAALANKLLFKTAAGEIALSKTGDHWGLDKPIKGRAEDMRVTEFVGDILNMQIAAFAPSDATLNGCGLSEPRGSVTIWTLGGSTPVTLQIGAHDAQTNQTFAHLSNRDAICLLPKQIERILTLLPDELRDRHLLRIDMDQVDRLAIEASGKPGLVLKREQEDWVRLDRDASKPVNQAKVQTLIKALQTGTVAAFVDDVASDLPKYGLDRPQLRVRFSSYSSENTAESTAGEHPLLTVDFGNPEGETVYARVVNEPSVVSVGKALLTEISGDPAEWRPLPVFRFKPEEIIALEVTQTPGNRICLKRNGTAWQLANASGVANSVNVESLVNTLAKLDALNWTGSDTTALKAPSETIAFRTADGKSGKLLLGAASAANGCAAMIEGDSAAFTVSAPDESALRLPLSE